MNSRFSGFIVAAALLPLLAACTPASSPASTDRPAASPSASDSPGASATPSASPSVTASPASGTPVTEDCLDLVSLDTMYAFDPNFAYNPSFTPEAGSLAAEAVAQGGVACGWVRETGGGTVVISVARPGESTLTTLREDAGGDSSFVLIDDRGVAQLFGDDTWITATSEYFASPSDATPLTDSVSAALG